eukprot:UN08714
MLLLDSSINYRPHHSQLLPLFVHIFYLFYRHLCTLFFNDLIYGLMG